MIASIHQPAYLPWLGYFHKILHSDVFVLLDTVQLEKNGFVNRNRVWTAGGVQWLTVPVCMKGHMNRPIAEMRINQDDPWRRKHVRTLEAAYAKRPHYGRYAGEVRSAIEGAGDSLADFLGGMLSYFLDAIGMKEKRILRASDLRPEGSRSALLLDICRKVGADAYLSGAGGRGYLDAELFERAGVGVVNQEFRHPEYEQGWEGFEPNLGVVDALFNRGGEAVLEMLRKSGSPV